MSYENRKTKFASLKNILITLLTNFIRILFVRLIKCFCKMIVLNLLTGGVTECGI